VAEALINVRFAHITIGLHYGGGTSLSGLKFSNAPRLHLSHGLSFVLICAKGSSLNQVPVRIPP